MNLSFSFNSLGTRLILQILDFLDSTSRSNFSFTSQRLLQITRLSKEIVTSHPLHDNSKEEFISAVDLQTFKQQGFLVLRNLISEDWRKGLSEALLRLNINRTGGFVKLAFGSEDIFMRYCELSPLPKLAAALLGSKKVYLYFDHVIVKEANSPKDKTNWHNDVSYWPIIGKDVISFWMPFSTVSKENGALEFIGGSHLWPNNIYLPSGISGDDYKYPNPSDRNNSVPEIPNIEEDRDSYDITCCTMNPGDVVAFYGTTLHAAGGNTSTGPRIAYSIRYCGEDATFWKRKGSLPFLMEANLENGQHIGSDPKNHPKIYEME